MAGLQITRQLLRMRRDWDRRAKENARHYVVTGQHQWTDEEFFQSGQITLEEEILNDLENICQGKDPREMKVLEIGWKDLSVVNRGWRRRLGIVPRLEVDFAFSIIVFQHIPSRKIIENYVHEVHRMLRPGGLFKFQVQGCAVDEAEPDHSWIGSSFTEAQAREMADRCGFEMRHQYGAGDQYYWLWFFKR